MTRQKRSSSVTEVTNPEPLNDNPLAISPTAQKRLKKKHEAGDGWLWRPSGPKIPSPNASPIPLRWDRPSPPRSKSTTKKKSKSKKSKKPKDVSREQDDLNSISPPPTTTPHSGTIGRDEPVSDAEEEGQVSVESNIDCIGHTPGPGAKKTKKTSPKSIETVEAASDQPKYLGYKSKKTLTEDLRTCTDRLDAVEELANQQNQDLRDELASLRESIQALEERTQRNEMRAAIRHDIIFDVIKKISHDVNMIRSESTAILSSSESVNGSQHGAGSELGSVSPELAKKKTNRLKSPGPQRYSYPPAVAGRQTMEHCLSQYTEQLNNASTHEEVKECGELCKKYADNLIKNYI